MSSSQGQPRPDDSDGRSQAGSRPVLGLGGALGRAWRAICGRRSLAAALRGCACQGFVCSCGVFRKCCLARAACTRVRGVGRARGLGCHWSGRFRGARVPGR